MSVAHAYGIGLRNVVATFGAKVSKAQIDLLKAHEKVIVWFDADPAGMAGEAKLLEGLHRHTEVLRVRPEEGKDLADYDMDGFCRHTALNTMPAALRLGEINRGSRHGRQASLDPHPAQRREGTPLARPTTPTPRAR